MFSFAIYPNSKLLNDYQKLDEYIKRLKAISAYNVFTSIHQPEYSLKEQLESLSIITKYAHNHDLIVTVDIGGSVFSDIINNLEYKHMFKEALVDRIRLDYGFKIEEVKEFINAFNISSIVLNASMITEVELNEMLDVLKSHLSTIEISACHNFYPRKETGLSFDYAKSQSELFYKYGLNVEACVATHFKPRGPLFEGLPTIEAHRYASITRAMIELYEEGISNTFLFGDDLLNEAEISEIENYYRNKEIDIYYYPINLSLSEKIILEKSAHTFRVDSNDLVLRSHTSREMAEFATKITKSETLARKAGYITIDNENYLRYSGELQVVLKDLEADKRVNCVAKIDKEYMWAFKYFRKAYKYKFIEKKGDTNG